MVSAFAARQRLALAQTKVGEKSNEIPAIPALLDMLSIEGAVVTIDAMGRQREIAGKIIDKKADYILALKGNQGTLREHVELFANEQNTKGFADTTVSADETVDGDHGRIETRRVTVVHDVARLQKRHDWPGLAGLVVVGSAREIGMRTERETRYYLTSSAWRADRLGPMVRDHWEVENGLHGIVTFPREGRERTIRGTDCHAAATTSLQQFGTMCEEGEIRTALRRKPGIAGVSSDRRPSLCSTPLGRHSTAVRRASTDFRQPPEPATWQG